MNNKATPLQIAMKNAGKKIKAHKVPSKPKENSKASIASYDSYYPPELRLSEKDFPDVENFAVGQKIQLAISVEVTGMNTREEGDKKRFNCDLKLTEISDITPVKGA